MEHPTQAECPRCRDWGKYETHEDHSPPLTIAEAFAMSTLAKENRDRQCGGISIDGAAPTICEVHLISWDRCPFRSRPLSDTEANR